MAAPRRRLSQLVEDPKHMRAMVEKFNYVDANHDGSISIDELKEVYKMFDPEYDEAKVAADFEKFDADHNGKVSMAEFLRAEGIDVSKFDAAELEQARVDELEAEQEALRQGVAAVEIVPGGMESQEVGVEASCVSAVGVEGYGQAVDAVAAVAECVAVEGDYVLAGEAVAVEAVPM